MKKRAIAFGLAFTLTLQPILATPSFATDNPSVPVQTPPTLNEPLTQYTFTISDEGLELIKSFEGFSAYPVWDYQQYSYGYGSYVDSTTVYEDPNSPTGYSTTLYPNGIPEREAAELLREMVEDFNVSLNNFLETNKIALNQNQFDALSSFTYNLGKYVWSGDYVIIDMLKSGEYLTNPEAFIDAYCDWCHAGGEVVPGLVERREREMAIFYSEYSLSDPNADLYVVNATTLYIRSEPSTSSSILGSLKSSQVIRVHKYNEDKQWAFTSYCGYFGWVSMGYLISTDEASLITQVDSNGRDEQGILYTFDNLNMTATVGTSASGSNTSTYAGASSGAVFLTKHLLYNGSIYTLNAISDSSFTNCSTISSIFIPDSVTSIGANAFKGSSLETILYTTGSYAEQWAKNSSFKGADYRCRSGHVFSDWTVTQTVTSDRPQIQAHTCSICGATETRTYDHLEILSYPTKIEYKQDETFDPSGLALTIVYTDGTRITAPSYKVVSADTSKLGEQKVTVGYSTLRTSFNIIVSEKTLTDISVSSFPTKLSYIEGEALVTDGLAVQANYNNGQSIPISEYTVSGFDPNKIGKQAVTVAYNGFTTTFNVTVRAKALTTFGFVSYPQKLEYFCGEYFDPTGMVLKLSYDNGTSETVDTGFKISGFNSGIAGEQTVKVTYGTVTQSIRVFVILNYLKSDKYTPDQGMINISDSNMTVAQFTAAFDSGNRVEVLKDGKVLPADSKITTGMTVRLRYNEQVQDTAKLIISGDLTGDGKCSVNDFLMLSDHLLGRTALTEDALLAADYNRDGKVDLLDYVEVYAATGQTSATPLSAAAG